MSQPDYAYDFSDITDGLSAARVISYANHTSREVRVQIRDNRVLTGTGQRMSGIIADMVDLALAVSAADRLSSRCGGKEYHIDVTLPVRCFEIFFDEQVEGHLKKILYWFTGDHWSFHFTDRKEDGRLAERQFYLLNTGESPKPVEVALWSGGLDALSGLYNRMLREPSTRYTLIGSGSNKHMHTVQKQLAEAVCSLFHDRINLIQIPLHWDGTQNIRKESSPRSRGFVFMLLGAACAALEQQNTLHIYENGIGAINLPFRRSEVGLDHSRSVHPLSLLMMGDFVSQLLGFPFAFQNPFLFWTKAQMCAALQRPEAIPLMHQSVSCDRRLRARPTQCGCCSSCVLRRQALAVLGIGEDVEGTYASKDSWDGHHLRAMLSQVNTLHSCLNTNDPWFYLSKEYSVLSEIGDRLEAQEGKDLSEVRNHFIHLYRRYIHEWDAISYVSGSTRILTSDVRKVA